MMQIQPRSWELDALERIEGVWLSVMSEKGHPFEEIEDEAQTPRPRLIAS
jgi:hypothetical protein